MNMPIDTKKLDVIVQRQLMTRKELAEAAGIPEITARKILAPSQRIKNVSSRNLKKICSALQISIDQIKPEETPGT